MFDENTADRAVSFIQSLKHVEGEWAGQYIKLEPDQKKIIRDIFGTLRDDGTRQYRMAYISVPRKWGKSTLAAAIALCVLFIDNEPAAQIYIAAADREQAGIVYRIAAEMVRKSPTLSAITRTRDSVKRIIVPESASFLHAISAEAYSKHGFNSHCVIYDELHAAPDRELWDVLNTSMGARRQPLFLQITTAGFDRESICWNQYQYAKGVLDGNIIDPSYYAYIREAEIDADWTDPEVWKAAQPNLGITVKLKFYEQECARAKNQPSYQNTFRRLMLNQWTEQSTRWIDMDVWDSCGGVIDSAELYGQRCYCGIDLSSTTDLTAVVLAFPQDDGSITLLPQFWLPQENLRKKVLQDHVDYDAWERDGYLTTTPGRVIDYRYVMDYIIDCVENYDVREVAYDPWSATQLATDLSDKGLTMIQFRQGYASMSPASKEFERLLVDGKINHGDHPVLRWMAGNVAVQQDAAGNIKPDKAKSNARIDGIVASIMAVDRCLRHCNDVSVYEERGLLTV